MDRRQMRNDKSIAAGRVGHVKHRDRSGAPT